MGSVVFPYRLGTRPFHHLLVKHLKIRPSLQCNTQPRHPENRDKVKFWIIRVLCSVFVGSSATSSPRVETACHIRYHCQQGRSGVRFSVRNIYHVALDVAISLLTPLIICPVPLDWSSLSLWKKEKHQKLMVEWQKCSVAYRSKCSFGQGKRLTRRDVWLKQSPKSRQCEAFFSDFITPRQWLSVL